MDDSFSASHLTKRQERRRQERYGWQGMSSWRWLLGAWTCSRKKKGEKGSEKGWEYSGRGQSAPCVVLVSPSQTLSMEKTAHILVTPIIM